MKTLLLHFVVLFLTQVVMAQSKFPTVEMEPFYDIHYTQAERDSLYSGLLEYQKSIVAIHQYTLNNSVPMSLVFNPLPTGMKVDTNQKPIDWGLPKDVIVPTNKAELAFYPVHKLAVLIKNKKISSTELTKLFIARLKKYGDTLQCVITLLEDTALKQAQRADEEIAKGKYRGPLHGIPFGIKDLLAVEGTKTTWGAAPYKDQSINSTATVVRKLEEAGAVLTVKLTMGALALGDIWFGGVTKNPWNLSQGSSGSSAGSASATAAGLIPFAIGTETLGSIVSPSTRCGTTGLRPTFGAVSRTGAMALSWSMDKIGPITRSALDCAIIFDAIRGEDAEDPATRNASFNYSAKIDLKKLRVGYIKSAFDATYPMKANDEKVLEVIRSLGVQPEAVELPATFPVTAIRLMLTVEAAAAFDELTRSDRDSLMTNQRKWAWPNTFRTARLIPAVDYINASRIRYQLIQEYNKITKVFDVIISPSFGGSQLLITNLTGHPCLVMPNGFNEKGVPTSISFIGKLYGEAALISLGRAYQERSEWDEKHPDMFQKP
jgi:Asp-tRNA(Asn)/Glu-tRNA(Gln) amidotransferase A subunit family amidase